MRSLPVLVVSCDRYADLWPPFFELFWRHWPDCRGPVYLGTNFQPYDDPRVSVLNVGKDVSWATSVGRMLDQIESDYLIVMLEDFLLTERVNNARIERLAHLAVAEGVGCLRLYSILPPERRLQKYPELGWFAPGDPYRITAQAAVWRKGTLRKLLVPGFSPWDFELTGSQMSDRMPDPIWGVMEPAIVYEQSVEKGKWRPQGLAICRAAGITPDLARRGAFSEHELHEHEESGRPAARFAARKNDAIRNFRQGRRSEGLRDLLSCLRHTPASPQLWAIGVAGMLGPRPITWLHRLHVHGKIVRARRAYHRALRVGG